MRKEILLYTNPEYPITKEILEYYPGAPQDTQYLLIKSLNNKVHRILAARPTIPNSEDTFYSLKDIRSNDSGKYIYKEGKIIYYLNVIQLDKSLISPQEIKYLEEKYLSNRDYEDYSRSTIEYLYSQAQRLSTNDYNYFLARLDWKLSYRKVEDIYGSSLQSEKVGSSLQSEKVPEEWGAESNHNRLIFLLDEYSNLIEIYSGLLIEDEYRYETIIDRKPLKYIPLSYKEEFKRWCEGLYQ